MFYVVGEHLIYDNFLMGVLKNKEWVFFKKNVHPPFSYAWEINKFEIF
jgi:hypothetical protein